MTLLGRTCSYDAWGKLLSRTGSMANTLGQYNPLRYRGYVYDLETGFYYLQSRYYDPEWGRFINADAFASTGQGFVGNNMFAYCLNNPIVYVDLTGAIPMLYSGESTGFSAYVDTPKGQLLYKTSKNAKGYLTEHWVDSNGKIQWSRHHSNHGNSKNHPVVPHDHDWHDDDHGNHTEDRIWQSPNPGFKAPGPGDDNSTKILAGAIGSVAVGYAIYTGVKWIIAVIAAPVTGGGSIIAAGVTP